MAEWGGHAALGVWFKGGKGPTLLWDVAMGGTRPKAPQLMPASTGVTPTLPLTSTGMPPAYACLNRSHPHTCTHQHWDAPGTRLPQGQQVPVGDVEVLHCVLLQGGGFGGGGAEGRHCGERQGDEDATTSSSRVPSARAAAAIGHGLPRTNHVGPPPTGCTSTCMAMWLILPMRSFSSFS